MLLHIDENKIKDILRNYKEFKGAITERILSLYKEMEDADRQLDMVAYKKPNLSGLGGGSSDKKDLFDVLEKHEKNVRMLAIEIRTEVNQLVEEEETYNRVWSGYRSLRGEAYDIITDLYVNGEPYKAVEAEHCCSHRKFEFIRKSALTHILKLYESDLSNPQIVSYIYSLPKRTNEKESKEEADSYTQLKLSI